MNHFFQFLNSNDTVVNCHHLNHIEVFENHNLFHEYLDENEYDSLHLLSQKVIE